MKSDLNPVLYAYESTLNDILEIIGEDDYYPALEADGAAPAPASASPTAPAGGSVRSTTTTTTTTTTTATGNNAPGADRKSAQTVNNAKLASSDTSKNPAEAERNKANLVRNITAKVKALIEKIQQILSSLALKLQNRFRLMRETDKGFSKMYYSRKAMVKPYNATKVISYQYNDNFLEQTVTKMMQEVTLCIDRLRIAEGSTNSNARISQIVSAQQGQTISTLLSPYVKDANVNTIPKFIKYMTSEFRGEKKELVYRANQLPNIEKFALSTKDLQTKCEQYSRNATTTFNRLKALEFQIRRNSDNKQLLEMVAQNMSKASLLYNAYSSILHTYFELKLEEALNYRQILKRFYQF